jgi:formamidopyrimidine-DNA glycosylase
MVRLHSIMPELPEVETIVRALAPRVRGRRIVSAEILHPRAVRHSHHDVAEQSAGRRIIDVVRHGKLIVMQLDQGCLTIHLGMTGQLLLDSPKTAYTRAVFQLDDATLLFDDIRTFGSVEWAPTPERTAKLGPEPLAVDSDAFFKSIRGRKAPIKSLLLNQSVLRGIGNIYTDEALFRAGIRPTANGLSRARAERLLASVKEVLEEAILHRGSSVSDYVDTEGRRGSFQDRHRVYGREGLPCPNCGTPIKRTVVAQRGTHYCPRCQR